VTAIKPRLSHLHPFMRGVRLHWRLLLALAAGVMIFIPLPAGWALSTRLLASWVGALGLYLVLTAALTFRCDLSRLRQRAAEEDEGAIIITVLATLAALASLGAIFIELGAAKANPGTLWPHVALAVATIALSWLFIHTIFAQHYANEYYDDTGIHAAGLQFPGDAKPDYWDFLYFSLVIGMTSQVSDVAVTSSGLRRIVAAHGVLSFVFNTAIIALTVNIGSSVI
jgi:uncharacterized membrane protein